MTSNIPSSRRSDTCKRGASSAAALPSSSAFFAKPREEKLFLCCGSVHIHFPAAISSCALSSKKNCSRHRSALRCLSSSFSNCFQLDKVEDQSVVTEARALLSDQKQDDTSVTEV